MFTGGFRDIRKTSGSYTNFTTAQSAKKVGGGKLATMADLGQDIKTAMTGGSVAVVGENAIVEENIVDKQVTERKTSFISVGKNKFDKTKAIDGKTIQWHNGTYADNASYFTSEKMEIPSPLSITISGQSNVTYVLRDKDGNYVRGLNITQNPLTITTTENEKTLEISVGLTRKDLIQVEFGSSATSYEPYSLKMDSKLLPENYGGGTSYSRLKIVSPNGDADYITIQGAVNASVDGDTILVLPGTYVESLKMRTKDIAIVGVDKTKCILKSTSSDYYSPTLEVAKGTIRNMTIYCERPAGANWDGSSLLAYAIHYDFAESIGKEMLIEDCIIKSGWNSVLGIGMQNNSELILRNNDIIQFGNLNNVPTKGALYAHNTNNSNAEFIMDNNRIIVEFGNVMNIDEVYSASTGKTICTFINNNLVSKEKGVTNIVLIDPSIEGGFSGKTMHKTVNSFGNNVPILNA